MYLYSYPFVGADINYETFETRKLYKDTQIADC